jgi:hypothetical protein
MKSLPWPLPALLAWGAAWLLYLVLGRYLPALWALLLACALPVAASPWAVGWWRRALLAAGFPLALLLSDAAPVAGWVWLAPLALLLLVYPLGAWRDAPLFPTPRGALSALGAAAPLPVGARLLDAGCGLGDGLIALRQAYPEAHFEGIERSRLLQWLCAWRCPWAYVRRGDIWEADWASYALVYLFQRPESMARALAKAQTEMEDGTWLVSLEFAVPDAVPVATLKLAGDRTVWLYRIERRDIRHANSRQLAAEPTAGHRARGYFGR